MSAPSGDDQGLPQRRLLLVGRDLEVLGHLSAALGARNYSVATATPGPSLWRAITRSEPQLVAIDVASEDMVDPLDDLTRIKQMIPEDRFVPVVALFPEKIAGHIIKAFQQGADDFLIRPFELFELALRLEVMWRMKRLQDEVLAANRRLHALSVSDDLTGLCNQREFKRRLSVELERIERFDIPVSVIFFDCDHFKKVNDSCGHAMGSYVIKEVARILVANLREIDILCRYGGDEFVIALPGSTESEAAEVAERLRGLVAMTAFRMGQNEVYITLSMGVAGGAKGACRDLETILKRADLALYASKAGGRDRVTVYRPELDALLEST
ncbi:MAG: GGDEF domain-containing protein [Bradymonadia bacterium]